MSEHSTNYSSHFPDSGIEISKVTETDKLAKILATMMEREADREQERHDREAREQNKREEEYERREAE